MKAMIRNILDHGVQYQALMFVCPGCDLSDGSGLHILPVNTNKTKPAWTWNGNLEAPTVSPSILTKGGGKVLPYVCHSYLKAGIFEFLGDCTHALVNQHVAMPDLPDWVIHEREITMDEETVTETTTETVTETHDVDADQAAKDAAGISGGSDTSAEARAARAADASTAAPLTGDEAAGISGELGKDLSGAAADADAQTLANASPASTDADAPTE